MFWSLEPSKQRRGLVAMDGAMALIVILLIVQIWLLSALAGHIGAVLPATIFSGLIFSGCLALNFFVKRVDEDSHR
jgi:hypothetical protein